MAANRVEMVVERISSMDRESIVKMLRGMKCDFQLDFSDEFLGNISLERLRHIALAASLHARNDMCLEKA